MPHIATHTPPPPPGTASGLPPALPSGIASPTTAGVVELGSPAHPARKGVSLLIGAAVGGVIGFFVGGPIGAVVGAVAGAAAITLINRSRN